ARPQRQRHRRGDEDRRGHRPLHGRHHRLSNTDQAPPTREPWQGPRWPALTTSGKREPAMQRSKTYREIAETYDRDELFAPRAAIKIATSGPKKKFDQTVDVAMRLGVDPRKADQMVRGTVNLPHGTGKTSRV